MATSATEFERWQAHEPTTWSLQVFNRYDDELGVLRTAHLGAFEHVYRTLSSDGAKWTDSPKLRLGSTDPFFDYFKDLKQWSNSYNLFDNWMNLSAVLTIASNLETYIAAVVTLALESDPGVIIGRSRALDGAALIKHRSSRIDLKSQVMACTRGDWAARLNALTNLFGPLPAGVLTIVGDLEDLRQIRHRAGHAFGRDIEAAREHGLRQFIPMEKVSRQRANRLKATAGRMARDLDRHLLRHHIGDFEPLRFYARHQLSKETSTSLLQRARALKKAVGGIGAVPRGKKYCAGLINYWDAI